MYNVHNIMYTDFIHTILFQLKAWYLYANLMGQHLFHKSCDYIYLR